MNKNFFEPNPCYEPNSSSFDQYHSSQSSVTQQLPQRSNENIKLEMAKLIKNNRILLNDNVFPHEEASMEVLLAKERIIKLIQAWDEKQIESWSLPELLPQLLNDSRTINEMLKQREQTANLAVQQEQEEQANDEDVLQSREKFMKDIQTFLEKFSRYPFGIVPKVTSDDENECDVPVKDESSLVFTTFSNPIFDCNDDFTSSDDESISEDVLIDDFKVYSNPLFDDEIDPHCFNAESDFVESLSNRDTLIDSSLRFDFLEEFSGALLPTSIADEERIRREHKEYINFMEKLFSINSFPRLLENFHANTIVETLPSSIILVEDSYSQREEIDIFTGTDELLPPDIECDNYDSEGDIHFLEESLVTDSISLPKIKSFYFDHHDDPSFPRPPLEPPDVEIFFKPDSGVLTTNVVKGISEHSVLMPNILPILPTFDPFYLLYDTLLSYSSENEDKVFKPGILSYLLVSHQDKTTFDFSENPMMIYGGDIPLLDV
nr:hypothetical protein [Tanacetum cinerariifolium]